MLFCKRHLILSIVVLHIFITTTKYLRIGEYLSIFEIIFYSVFLIFLKFIKFIPAILLSVIMWFAYASNMTINGLFK